MKRVVLPFLFFVAVVLLAYQSLIAWDVRNVRNFHSSYSGLLKDASVLSCLTKDALVEASKARGWEYEDNRQPPYRSGAPDEFALALRVFVKPQLNFAKEAGVMFFFDYAGCLIG